VWCWTARLDLPRGDWIVTPSSATLDAARSRRPRLDTGTLGRRRLQYWLCHANPLGASPHLGHRHRAPVGHPQPAADRRQQINVNEIGHASKRAALPVEFFSSNRIGGALIVVDPTSNRTTSGALLVKK
jgi:sulfate adenylyltransferase subunit 1